MAWGGRLMPVGFVTGQIPTLPMNLPLLKNFSVVGVFAGAWIDAHPAKASAAVDRILAWVAQGAIVPHVDCVLPLAEAAEALRLVADRQVQGRVVLSLDR
jgi:NADPH2:quinone reductase